MDIIPKKMYYFAVGVVAVMLGVQPVNAQDLGEIQGTVYAADGTTIVTDAVVTIVNSNYSQQVDGSGQFIFEEVPAGSVLLHADSPVWGENSETVTVVAGETVTADIEILRHKFLDEMVITAGAIALRKSELVNPIEVLKGNDLLESEGVSLGEALKNYPGMAATYFGPAASRPIIGGVGGSRVKVLQHGLAVGDVSEQSEDHAVGADIFDARRVEIIRGPATLLYGSDITGGIVNVIDGRVPNERPVKGVEGMAYGRGGLGSNERGGGGRLTGAFGNVVWRAHGLLRETGDISTPSFNPEEEHEEHEEHEDEMSALVDHIENSRTSLGRGSVGMSWMGKRGYIGASISVHNSDYGIPGGHAHAHGDEHGEDEHEEDHDEDEHEEDHHDDEHEEDHHDDEEGIGEVSIDLASVNYDIEGAYRFGDGVIEGLRFRLGVSDYEHTEIEHLESGERENGIVYENNQWEGRMELDHALHRSTKGVVGIQIQRRDLEISQAGGGHASFLPSTVSTQSVYSDEFAHLFRLNLPG